jgi:hypothetical protein
MSSGPRVREVRLAYVSRMRQNFIGGLQVHESLIRRRRWPREH